MNISEMGKLRKVLLRWTVMIMIGFVVANSVLVTAESVLRQEVSSFNETIEFEFTSKAWKLLEVHKSPKQYEHVWPDMKFGWKIVVGTIIAFFGAAFGSVGGVGGGGIFVPMLTLIIGFDPKSSTAVSKCMITGAAAATVFYNIRQRHPTLDLPLIDYDLALLFQPMLVLGISIGVGFNVLFPDWLITILLIVLFLVLSTLSFSKGVQAWKNESIKQNEEAASKLNLNAEIEISKIQHTNPKDSTKTQKNNESMRSKVSFIQNIHWKELGILVVVWVIILSLQIAKNYTPKCSVTYWVLNFLQIPVAIGVTAYEAVSLYKGKRKIESKGEAGTHWQVHKLVIYCAMGILAGIVGGMLGLGGGFILGPVFLEIGIPPQVSSATATFAMVFSASMSVVEYYLLKRFPIPYALYLSAMAMIAAFAGQHVVGKVIKILGRASLIIFILSGMIFASALTLGGVGIANMVKKIARKEYMGFEDMCS